MEDNKMLDQLVESRSHLNEDKRRAGFLATTLVVFLSAVLIGILYSLFAKELDLPEEGLALETLVAPPIVEEAPKPEPEKPQEEKKAPNVDIRKEIIAAMSETPPKIPDKVSTVQNTVKERDPNKFTMKGDRDYSAANAPPPDYTGPVNTKGSGSDSPTTSGGGDDEGGAPAPPPPPVKKPTKPISGGVLNGKARSLPTPVYPAAARAVRASGAVTVQVTIDEDGNVISAVAVSGNPLLRQAAVDAARRAKFSPTLLSGQPVKVTGVITYNFIP
ncbi:MAG TPA: energy transducer TonB [Pyrinomonadaceae bacterium]|nr:energy transducer TonB [Pyrinomonadaceae bacterium]